MSAQRKFNWFVPHLLAVACFLLCGFTPSAADASTISFSSVLERYADNTPVSGALIEQAENPLISTSADALGAFTLTGLPAGSEFTVKMSLAGGSNIPTYTAIQQSTTNIVSARIHTLFTATDLSGWGVSSGGAIRGRVMNSANMDAGYVSGATVSYASLLGRTDYVVKYQDNQNNMLPDTGTTSANGLFYILNVAEGDMVTVTVTVTHPNYTFPSSRRFATHANAVCQGSIGGNALAGGLAAIGGYVKDKDSLPINKATVEQVGATPQNSTTSLSDGSYYLTVPTSTAFFLKIAKPQASTPLATSYSAEMTLSASNLNMGEMNLFPASKLSNSVAAGGWGISAGKGIIRSRVRDKAGTYLGGGATVTYLSSQGRTYTICYDDACSGSYTSTQADTGRYVIKDVEPGDTVTVTAVKEGYTFNSRVFHVFADSVHQGFITGTPPDETLVRNSFQDMITEFNKGAQANIAAIMAHFSTNYLNDGQDYAAQQADIQSDLNQVPFQPMAPTIERVTVNLATVETLINWGDGSSDLMIWLKEGDGVWRIIGNGARHQARVFSQHWADGYHASFSVEDPSHGITSVAVNGPGIIGGMNLEYDAGSGNWYPMSGTPFLGTTPPVGAQTYTLTVTEGGLQYPYVRTITGYVNEIAMPLSPFNTMGSPLAFVWLGIPHASQYGVELSGDQGQRLWNKYEIPATQWGVPYDGPALESGKTYTYFITAMVSTDGVDNMSLAQGQFTYAGSSQPVVTYSSVVKDVDGTPLGGAGIEQWRAPMISSTTSAGDGSFTLGNILAGVPMHMKFTAPGFVPTYSAYMGFMANTSSAPGSAFNLLSQANFASMGVAAGKGIIRGRVRDTNGNYLEGVTITTTSALGNVYAVRYYDDAITTFRSTGGTYASGRFVVMDVADGDMVTVNGQKNGYIFNFNVFSTYGGSVTQGGIGVMSTGCTYGINPSSVSLSGSGTIAPVSVTVSAGSGCNWAASSTDNWIHVESGATGSGNGVVSFTVDANPDAMARGGTLSIAGQTFTVNQAAFAPPAITLVQNGNFDGALLGWDVNPALWPWNPFLVEGAVNLQPPSGDAHSGQLLYQNLDVSGIAGQTVQLSMNLSKIGTPPSGNTVAAYLTYLDGAGGLQKVKVLGPSNDSISTGTLVASDFTFPPDATKLVMIEFAKEGPGEFHLDNVVLGGTGLNPGMLPPHLGTWGTAALQRSSDDTWYAESSMVIFKADGTGFVIGRHNENGMIGDHAEPFTYTISANADGSYTFSLTFGAETKIKRVVVADNGSMAIMDGTDDPARVKLTVMAKVESGRIYRNADLSGDYYSVGFERNVDNVVDPPGGNGRTMAISSLTTFSGTTDGQGQGTYTYAGKANSVFTNGSNGVWDDVGDTIRQYAVLPDGSMMAGNGAFLGGLGAGGNIFGGTGSYQSNNWLGYFSMKKGDRAYATTDLGGKWAIVSLGQDNKTTEPQNIGFTAQIGTMTCNAIGQCSLKFRDRRSTDGSTNINTSNAMLNVNADGSFGASLPGGGAPAYAGAIGNSGNTILFNGSFDAAQPWHREVFVGVRASAVGDLAGGTSTPPISVSGLVKDWQGAVLSPAASVTLVGDPGKTTTTSTQDGSFSLSDLAANTPMALKFSRQGYLDTYTANLMAAADINLNVSATGSGPFNLATEAELAALGALPNPGKGVIFVRVSEATFRYSSTVGGVVVTATGNGGKVYPVSYQDPFGNLSSATATWGNGRCYVLNVDDGDSVTVSATKNGWSFASRVFATHAGGLSQGRITGPAAEYLTMSGQVANLTGMQPLAGARLELHGDSGKFTTSLADGSYTFGGLPRDASFYGKVTLNGYAPTYAGRVTLWGNATGINIPLLTPAEMAVLGVTGNNGLLLGKVVDQFMNPVSGATVALTSKSGASYAALYDGVGATAATGHFWVANVQPGDVVRVEVSKGGYSFPMVYLDGFSGAVTARMIPGTTNDEALIRSAMAAAIAKYDSNNIFGIDGFQSYVSSAFYNDGESRAQFLAEVQTQRNAGQPLAYQITSIQFLASDLAEMALIWNGVESDTLTFHKEGGVWLLYGNQRQYRVEAWSAVHRLSVSQNNYWVGFQVNDAAGSIQGVTVTGPTSNNPQAVFELVWNQSEGNWQSWNGTGDIGPQFGNQKPTLPLTYSFTINERPTLQNPNPTPIVVTKTIDTFLDTVFAAPLSPAGGATVIGSPTFTWSGSIPAGLVYLVELRGDNGFYWNSENLPGTASSFTYNGPPLVSGSYAWHIQVRDMAGNFNMVMSPAFSIQAPQLKGDIDGNGALTLRDAVLGLKVMVGLSASGLRPNYPASGTDVNGDGKVGLPELARILRSVAGLP